MESNIVLSNISATLAGTIVSLLLMLAGDVEQNPGPMKISQFILCLNPDVILYLYTLRSQVINPQCGRYSVWNIPMETVKISVSDYLIA